MRLTSTIPLEYFLSRPNIIKPTKQNTPEIYAGNALDASHPKRSVGKHREIPKPKAQSKLKQDIQKQRSETTTTEITICY